MAVDERETITRAKFIRRWIWATLLGYFAGVCTFFVLSSLLFQSMVSLPQLWPGASSDGVLDVAGQGVIYLIVMCGGAAVGFVQWNLSLPFNVTRRRWVITNALACLIVLLLLPYLLTGALQLFSEVEGGCSGFCGQVSLSPRWPVNVISLGLLVGIAIGIPQAVALRASNSRYRSLRIIPAKMMGVAVVLLISVILIGQVETNNDYALIYGMYCCGPIIFAAISGLAIHKIQHRM